MREFKHFPLALRFHWLETEYDLRSLSKSTWLLLLLVLGLGVAMTFVKGFGNLSYYPALFFTIVFSLVGIPLGISIAKPLSSSSLWDSVKGTIWLPGIMTLAIVLLLSFNHFRSQTCDWGLGLAFFAMGPFLSAHLFMLIGVMIQGLGKSRTQRTLLGILTLVSLLIWEAEYFYCEPAVFSYSPLFGYLAGPIYDAAIILEIPYFLSRAIALAFAWGLYLILYSTSQRPKDGKTLFAMVRVRLGGILVIAAIACTLFAPHQWGLHGRLSSIDSLLSEVVENSEVALHYEPGSKKRRAHALRIYQDAQYRYKELETFFGGKPEQTLHIYLYSNPRQKRHYMGAERVRIAKPWLDQVHISGIGYGSPVLLHEMAHVFGAPIAEGWFGIPTHFGVFPKMALVEGLSTLLEGRRGDRSLHQWAAALSSIKKLPKISKIMGPGGYTQTYGPAAYTTAGSFLLYLDSVYGRNALLAFYRTGDPKDALGKSLGALEGDWIAFLGKEVLLPSSVLEEARFYYDRKPVLSRTCPVVVARLEREARRLLNKSNPSQALSRFDEVCLLRPELPAKQLNRVLSLAILGRFKEAIDISSSVYNDESQSGLIRFRARQLLADVEWLSGQSERAHGHYERLLEEPLSASTQRSLRVKYLATQSPMDEVQKVLRDYLLNVSLTGKIRRKKLLAALDAHPNHPLLLYLAGKLKAHKNNYDEAASLLGQAIPLLKHPMLLAEAHTASGKSLHLLERHDEAIHSLQTALNYLPKDRLGLRVAVSDWLKRAQYYAGEESP